MAPGPLAAADSRCSSDRLAFHAPGLCGGHLAELVAAPLPTEGLPGHPCAGVLTALIFLCVFAVVD
jgi:hypothetical protein